MKIPIMDRTVLDIVLLQLLDDIVIWYVGPNSNQPIAFRIGGDMYFTYGSRYSNGLSNLATAYGYKTHNTPLNMIGARLKS